MDTTPSRAAHSVAVPSNRRSDYPEPLVIPPTATHTHSIIILHGRGSYATRFGLELLKCQLTGGKTLQGLFPSVKFIFPTARRSRATVYKRKKVHQWFDNYTLDDPTERQDLQFEGLQETTAFIHGIARREAAVLDGGVQRVVIGGLSQGCAAGLIAALSFFEEGGNSGQSNDTHVHTLGGFFGISGWLPFARDIATAAVPAAHDLGDEDITEDIFGSADGDDDNVDNVNNAIEPDDESRFARQARAATFVRDLVNLPPLSQSTVKRVVVAAADDHPLYRMPCFIGHGKLDERVSVNLGLQIQRLLAQLKLDVTWKQYDELGHWYQVPEELDDIAAFLVNKLGLPHSADAA